MLSYYDPNDVFGCVADIGWITGHSYVVYGPLVNGGISLLFESTPNYPGKIRDLFHKQTYANLTKIFVTFDY